MSATLAQKVEAILFFRGEPVELSYLTQVLQVSEAEVQTTVDDLAVSFMERGVRVLRMQDQFELVTAPETSDVVMRVKKEEVTRELGKAGAETLAIVLYRGPVSRARIEHIRGVNCSFVLRNLMIRGLIERAASTSGARVVEYVATPETLKHLGVTAVQDLPEYAATKEELDSFEATNTDQENAVKNDG